MKSKASYYLYFLLKVIFWVIRSLVLPNPFSPLEGLGEIVNLVFGGVLFPVSYFMTGLFYHRGDDPAAGSVLYMLFYVVNSGVTYLIMLTYPFVIGMVIVAAVYFAIILAIRHFICRN